MNILKQYLANHPQELKDWLDQFPWDHFDAEITIPEDEEEKTVIARKVILGADAEVSGLLICQESEIGEGAEILGTMVCDSGLIDVDAECNYLIARNIIINKDAEIRSAIVSDSIKLESGAEIDELEILDSAVIDQHEHSLIKTKTELTTEAYREAVNLRLQIVLESAASQVE